MKTVQTNISLLLLALLFVIPVSAQKMTVESMRLVSNDATATLEENLHQDLNGHYGGLVKVYLAANDAQFLDPSIFEAKHVTVSEYWVFMAKDAFKLQVVVPGYLPLDIDFRDYHIERIESRHTYVLAITLSQAGNTVSGSNPSDEWSDVSSPKKKVFTVNGVSFTMVHVEGGTFTMGATNEQGSDAYDYEKPAHEVKLSNFCIGETEVTQALWQAVMGSNPSKFTDNPQNPVENISWEDCVDFLNKLNKLTKKKFRFPTEAEWEYAARGGNRSRHFMYAGSNNCSEVAWMWENSGDHPLSGELTDEKINNNHCKPHPVKTKVSNELGLYDMSGNVCEFCYDFIAIYKPSKLTNPKGPKKGSYFVYRGGSWKCDIRNCRVSCRFGADYNNRHDYFGLRLAL